jgi:hypothetical protein
MKQLQMSYGQKQRERLKSALINGKKITRLTAYRDLAIFELSSRIGELEKQGIVISRQRITVYNRYGEKTNVMEYRMEKTENNG